MIYADTSLTHNKPPTSSSVFDHAECDRSLSSEEQATSGLQASENPLTVQDAAARSQMKALCVNTSPWSLQPALHEDVLESTQPGLSVEFFEASGLDDCTRYYDTHIIGYFTIRLQILQ
jgi:hypothetical protein